MAKAVGPWTLEIQAAATFFTDNDDFYGGTTRSQDLLHSLQGHLIYGFRSGIWVSADGTYFAGGRTTVNGVLSNDLQQNWRVGATLALPVDRANSIKFYCAPQILDPGWTERLRVFRSCPLITPEDARSSLQMLAIARAMAALCASIGRLLARCSGTLEKLSASDPVPARVAPSDGMIAA